MNKNKMIVAVMAAAAGLGLSLAQAWAGEVNFDGGNGAGFISAYALKSGLAGFQGPAAAAEPVRDLEDDGKTLKIKTIVKSAGKTTEETLFCRPGLGADKISGCRKSDFTALSYEDVNALALRQYFSPETLKFADLLNQAKHSYTNQSGPQTFSCVDACYRENTIEINLGTILLPNIVIHRECVEWTHDCECVAGCY